MPRLFAGLEIPAHLSQALSALRGGIPGARWIEPSDYHITLRFLGDIDNRTASEVDGMLSFIARNPIPIKLSGLGSFGGDHPHSVHAAVEPNRALTELQTEIERMCRACGLETEKRKFTPHITLARLKNASPLDVASYLSARGFLPSHSFTANRFVLFSSRASVGGGPYMVETTYPFRWAA